jgi:NADH dehydrogenase
VTSPPSVPRVVVIGAGFGGLSAVKALRKAPVRITLIDRRNHHLFQPLLYQVATAGLTPSHIASPIRRIFRRQRNVDVVMGEVVGVDLDRKKLSIQGTPEDPILREVDYDVLIVAAGARNWYFGHDEWEAHAPGLKSLEDALTIRRKVLLAFERAECELDPEHRKALMTFVVVGGGPTGVELAGAIAELARHALARDFRSIDPTQARIILLEGVDRILTTFAPELSNKAKAQLEELGAEVRLGAMVESIGEDGIRLRDGDWIATETVVWGAGVAASPLGRELTSDVDRAGRVRVQPDLSLPGHPEVFAIGDLVALVRKNGQPVPGVAPAAIQQGEHAAKNVQRLLQGQPPLPFDYWDKGTLATIGRSRAVGQVGSWQFSGVLAWLMWSFIHILFLIGFRNRFMVMAEWAWSYFSFDKGSRLITGERVESEQREPTPA